MLALPRALPRRAAVRILIALSSERERPQDDRTGGGSGLRPSVRAGSDAEPASPFERIIECFVDGIAIHAGGRIVYVNPALASMLDYDAREGLEMLEWADFVHRDELADAVANVERALAAPEGTAFRPSQRRLLRKNGEPLSVELSAVRLTWEGVPALALVVRDRSERERLESGLRQAERMAAVGTLAAGVAHEINNPLAYVVANVAFASDRVGELTPANLETQRAALAEALDEARQGVDRVAQIVSDLKTFTRSEERVELVDLGEVLRSTIKMAGPTIRHHATIATEFGVAPRIKGRASRLGQVFLNLLVNAAQAIAPATSDARVTVRVGTTPDRRAFVEVEDNGAGIPAEVLPRVFEPFFTTKPFGVGTGLGLSVCKNIVEEHGGSIEVDSHPGAGTRVRVVVPPAPPGFQSRRSSASLAAVRPRRRRVLVIDDDRLVLKAMARLLRAHDVVTVAGGRAALDLLSEQSDFDVILCDLMMPEVSGMDVYETLAAAKTGLERRIVFVSGGAVTEHARELLERVPNLRLEKPLDPRRVEETLALAVDAVSAPAR